jgi:hypothetical protein
VLDDDPQDDAAHSTVTVHNIGNVPLTGIDVSHDAAGELAFLLQWPGAPGTLAPGQRVEGAATIDLAAPADPVAGANAEAPATTPAIDQRIQMAPLNAGPAFTITSAARGTAPSGTVVSDTDSETVAAAPPEPDPSTDPEPDPSTGPSGPPPSDPSADPTDGNPPAEMPPAADTGPQSPLGTGDVDAAPVGGVGRSGGGPGPASDTHPASVSSGGPLAWTGLPAGALLGMGGLLVLLGAGALALTRVSRTARRHR